MTPDQAAAVRQGLTIGTAYLDGDGDTVDRLLEPLLSGDGIHGLVESFLLAGILGADAASRDGARVPFAQALAQIRPADDVVLLPGLSVGPWKQIIALAQAYKTGGDAAAAQVPLTMDGPGAVNAAFRFMISALETLAHVPEFRTFDRRGLARMFLDGIDEGRAGPEVQT